MTVFFSGLSPIRMPTVLAMLRPIDLEGRGEQGRVSAAELHDWPTAATSLDAICRRVILRFQAIVFAASDDLAMTGVKDPFEDGEGTGIQLHRFVSFALSLRWRIANLP